MAMVMVGAGVYACTTIVFAAVYPPSRRVMVRSCASFFPAYYRFPTNRLRKPTQTLGNKTGRPEAALSRTCADYCAVASALNSFQTRFAVKVDMPRSAISVRTTAAPGFASVLISGRASTS